LACSAFPITPAQNPFFSLGSGHIEEEEEEEEEALWNLYNKSCMLNYKGVHGG